MRALILSDGVVLGPNLFELGDLDDAEAVTAPAQNAPLDVLERRAIEAALVAVGGNRRAAAARLGIGLRTLYEKLKRYEGER